MIILFCQNDDDYTHRIIEWLYQKKIDYRKIDLDEQSEANFEIDLNNQAIKFQLNSGEFIYFDEVSFFFFRGGNFKFTPIQSEFSNEITNTYHELDYETLVDYVYSKIMKKSFGWVNRTHLNKLLQLEKAKQHSLAIPSTHLLNSKDSFKAVFSTKDVITKGIQENVGIQKPNAIYAQRVTQVNHKDLPESFYPSLFQEKIDKTLEIRSFYLDGQFYSIAFLDNSEDLSVDMRDNYHNHINFRVDLPNSIEHKLDLLMKDLGLISGSIDLIYGKDEEFYFIEVNPEGQYNWVSEIGGYQLDEKIANFLANKEYEFNK